MRKLLTLICFCGIFASAANSARITNVSPAGLQFDTLEVGKHSHLFRDYTIVEAPDYYVGKLYLKTNADDKLNAELTIAFDTDDLVSVFVAFDVRYPPPGWLSDWISTGNQLITTDTVFDIYTKAFTAGRVTLGENNHGGSMYMVMFAGAKVDVAIETAMTVARLFGFNTAVTFRGDIVCVKNMGETGVKQWLAFRISEVLNMPQDQDIPVEQLYANYKTGYDPAMKAACLHEPEPPPGWHVEQYCRGDKCYDTRPEFAFEYDVITQSYVRGKEIGRIPACTKYDAITNLCMGGTETPCLGPLDPPYKSTGSKQWQLTPGSTGVSVCKEQIQ